MWHIENQRTYRDYNGHDEINKLQFSEKDYNGHDDDEIKKEAILIKKKKDFKLILYVKHQRIMKLTLFS